MLIQAAGMQIDLGDVAHRSFVYFLGCWLFAIMVISLLRTIVVPRALRSFISGSVMSGVVSGAWMIARIRKNYRARDSVMAWAGPLIIIMTLLTWLIGFVLAYGCMIYGLSGQSFGQSLAQSGSSLFTLGFDAGVGQSQTIIDFLAAATGPIVIALMIGFLPTIYSIYTEREVAVTRLSTQAGEPAWGPELLTRAQLGEQLAGIDVMFIEWTKWAAALRLTHLTYPSLIYVRSARAYRHYATSMLAMMDAAALSVSLTHEREHHEAFEFLAQGVQTLDTLYLTSIGRRRWFSKLPALGKILSSNTKIGSDAIAMPARDAGRTAVQLAASADAVRGLEPETLGLLDFGEGRPLQLTRHEFDEAYAMLNAAEYPIEYAPDAAWEMFRRLRQRYEFAAYAICSKLDAPPAPWSGTRRVKTETISPARALDYYEKPVTRDADTVIDDIEVPEA